MTRVLDWACWWLVMNWPTDLPDCRSSRAFSWVLSRAGRYAMEDKP